MKTLGFTLIELLATITILGIILTITIISVNGIISDSEKNLKDQQIKNIIDVTKTYYIKEGINIDNTCINLSDLVSKGYVDEKDIIDPETKEIMDGSVLITLDANQYSYKYQDIKCE